MGFLNRKIRLIYSNSSYSYNKQFFLLDNIYFKLVNKFGMEMFCNNAIL